MDLPPAITLPILLQVQFQAQDLNLSQQDNVQADITGCLIQEAGVCLMAQLMFQQAQLRLTLRI